MVPTSNNKDSTSQKASKFPYKLIIISLIFAIFSQLYLIHINLVIKKAEQKAISNPSQTSDCITNPEPGCDGGILLWPDEIKEKYL